jgi:hypothetical protein
VNKILLDTVNVADGIGDAVNVGATVEVGVTFVAVGASVGFGDAVWSAVNACVGVGGGVTVEAGAGAGVAQAVRIKMRRESLGKGIPRIIKRETRSLASLKISRSKFFGFETG